MSDELFNPEAVAGDSPRLRWMKEHGVRIQECPAHEPGDEDELGNELFQFYATGQGFDAIGGNTADEAIAAWAKSRSMRLWNEEAI